MQPQHQTSQGVFSASKDLHASSKPKHGMADTHTVAMTLCNGLSQAAADVRMDRGKTDTLPLHSSIAWLTLPERMMLGYTGAEPHRCSLLSQRETQQ